MATASYLMGTRIKTWREKDVKNITFVVTEDCNLVCKYCYITGKNKKNRMSIETAKKAVDYILTHPDEFPEGSVIWEFIGGEPFLEIELIDELCDYIKMQMFALNHKWFDNYRFSFSSNGLLYDTPAVQHYIQKNKHNVSIGLSVDGNKLKHDLQRIKPDGSGSYDDVVKNVPLWLQQFPENGTKATFSSSDLPYLKDSIISLYELGINEIAANVIFENCWQEGDDLILENQLRELADYIIEHKLWDTFNCTFFSDFIGYPTPEQNLNSNWCGAGKMLAIDYQGKFYPCVRFIGYSLNKREGYVIGDIEQGYDKDKLRPFLALDTISQSTDECVNCQVSTGCAWCQGYNYDEAKIPTVFERATYICKMHKARVRANDYYWNRLREIGGPARTNFLPRKDHLYFILADNSARHCTYDPETGGVTDTANTDVNHAKAIAHMPLEVLQQGLEFARTNFYTPVLLLPPEGLHPEEKALLKGMEYMQIYRSGQSVDAADNMPVHDNEVRPASGENCVLIVRPEQVHQVSTMVKDCLQYHQRVNLILENAHLLADAHLEVYENELRKIVDYLIPHYAAGNVLDVNVLTDRFFYKKMHNCNAGLDSFSLAPDGNLYICPAFYFRENKEAIGSIATGVNYNYQEFLTLKKSPVCSKCDVYHCRRCIYDNRERTREFLVPGKNQCVVSHIERKVGREMADRLKAQGITCSGTNLDIPEVSYYDPLEKILLNTK